MSMRPADDVRWKTRRCWRLSVLPRGVGGEVGDALLWSHFVDADDAVAAALDCLDPPTTWATLVSASAVTYSGAVAERGYCTVVVCDLCARSLGDEDEDIHEVHFASISDAREAAREAGWRSTDAGIPQVACPACQDSHPGGDWTRHEPGGAPGQLPLDGMDDGRAGRGDAP